MHSIFKRYSKILSLTIICLAFLCVFNWITGVLLRKSLSVEFELEQVYLFGKHRYFDEEIAKFSFNLKTDLSKHYNWNIDRIIPSLNIKFNSNDGRKNEITVWDDLITRKDFSHHIINLKSQKSKYFLTDVNKELRNKTVTVLFNLSFMPIIGFVHKQTLEVGSFTLPLSYIPHHKIKH
ncbi:unnamed protein product [Moneuplotes crassus]|uniref:Signal peptidase complex subunit 3 n=1 Tax=Euplotes crassus TaxID=5936 RepID=A0AAD2D637_EUPCR|nr:unnamed protein product [Moneuplotes crassus]